MTGMHNSSRLITYRIINASYVRRKTERRRTVQDAYNKEHNIIPKTIQKEIRDLITNEDDEKKESKKPVYSKKEKQKMIERLEKEMMEAARNLDFERATELRDIMFELKLEN